MTIFEPTRGADDEGGGGGGAEVVPCDVFGLGFNRDAFGVALRDTGGGEVGPDGVRGRFDDWDSHPNDHDELLPPPAVEGL